MKKKKKEESSFTFFFFLYSKPSHINTWKRHEFPCFYLTLTLAGCAVEG